MKKSVKLMILIAMVTFIFSVCGAYAATSYVISANKIAYSDNSSLGVDNVQAAIDGTCTKFNNQLTDIRKSMYPVGSIYLSATLSTTEEVKDLLGGEWEVYGKGKTLIGVDESKENYAESNKEGGSSTVSLTKENLPEHSHSYTPSGMVSKPTFTGSSVTTGIQSANHTHSIPSLTGTATGGNHTHQEDIRIQWYDGDKKGTGISTTWTSSGNNLRIDAYTNYTKPSGDLTLSLTTNPSTTGINSENHTHTVTAKGTISQPTFTGVASNTNKVGSNTPFSILNPYITVYMYKRVS